ncbi:multifunctional CCA addition/repair protein [Cellvibrio japonicus]|nr:multifunctional CCA addition/repair protein [Cellvibrio japonicus]QEI11427.1 multifunctional CCA addition/repair protein [Cellvibrio japonicus]QEI15001.1 multifunctional CCA addition/repair protein [Cellvibrio japonicus]QEI18581.1 multifunctional CCA addition/repair protein [Cellvibrio japonicus]
MKTYLVGGAVRDKLLGRPVHERDWVVIGSSPAAMEAAGFLPVGKDFPVFIHPQTKEEYALARTERKTGHGYGGFSFYCGENVALEEDLIRRDLTINAMAEDDVGNIIDPYGGQSDLQQRLLRHVSPAFAEDPVRILRVARFAARYHGLGFTLAEETLALMRSMVCNGEADHLVAERIWKETERALAEPWPHIFIQVLRDCGALGRLMPEVDALFGIPQTAVHHPEIDTGIHTLLSLQQAARLSPLPLVRFATLMHDLGKGATPPEKWPRHIAHEIRSLPLIKQLCDRIAAPKEYKELSLLVAEYHTHCHRALELTAATLLKTLQALDGFRRPERVEQFLLCCEADARGRTGLEARAYPQADYVRQALQRCLSVTSKQFLTQGLNGKALGDAIHQERLKQLQTFKTDQK